MPKRIFLPILITTSVIGIGTGAYSATKPLNLFAQNNLSIKSNLLNNTRTIEESFIGQKPRSNDFAFARSLGVDASKVVDAQTKVKDAENNLKNEMQSIRQFIKDAIVTKAREKNIDQNIIDDYINSYQKLEDTKKQLQEKVSNDDSTVQSVKNLRAELRDNVKTFKIAELRIKEAIE
ncbi:MAG: hypothetical protein H7196_04755 [candidate division SR1 bacterium]|nr:hypothetical protein [candidate division SR1 bacterium]